MIGVVCYTYVPGYNTSLSDIIAHIENITDEVHANDISDPFEWLETMVAYIVRYVFVGIICFIFFLAIIVTCIRSMCKTITSKMTTKMMIQVPPSDPTIRSPEEHFCKAFDELCQIDAL